MGLTVHQVSCEEGGPSTQGQQEALKIDISTILQIGNDICALLQPCNCFKAALEHTQQASGPNMMCDHVLCDTKRVD